LPAASAVAQEQFTPEVRAGVDHPTGVWFNERARELTFRSEKYDTAYTLPHLGVNRHRSGTLGYVRANLLI
jgi:hypothetical protein